MVCYSCLVVFWSALVPTLRSPDLPRVRALLEPGATDDLVRETNFQGQPIAGVAADTYAQARAALAHTYRRLPRRSAGPGSSSRGRDRPWRPARAARARGADPESAA